MSERFTRFLFGLYLFAVALWGGAMCFFAAAGARIVLETSTTRHAGGTVNRALLDALDLATFGACGFLFVLFLFLDREAGWTRRSRGLTLRLLGISVIAALASSYVITPEMVALRDRMGTIIDLVPKADPLRHQWGRLHAVSSVALLVRILSSAALFGLGLSAFSRRFLTPPPASAPQ